MKKYLLGVVLLALAAFSLVSATSAVSAPVVQTTSSQPATPGPSNPYCGKKPSDFGALEVVCPSDGYYQVDGACVAACDATYKAKMVEVYDAACSAYDNANDNYRLCFRLAIHAYDTCAAQAHTLYDLELCRNTMISSTSDCVNTLNTTRAGIAANVQTGTDAAKAAFQACASQCCKKVGHLGGDSNGGKIGGQGVRHDD